MNSLKIRNHKEVSQNNKLEVYNKPKIVYIPLLEDITLLVNKDDYVFKGSILAKIKGKNNKNIYSSVSGKIKGFEEKRIHNNLIVKCIVIENDFQERIESGYDKIKNLNVISKTTFFKTLENFGIQNIACFNNLRIDTLIINIEKYEALMYQKCEEILETIDLILEINNINKVIIISKNKNLIKIINNYIGTYLNIKVKRIYKTNKKTYTINDIGFIYNIYEILKYNKPITEKIISINNINILVKIGTSITEIMEYIGIDNGYNKDLIITNDLSIIDLEKNDGQNKSKNKNHILN